MGDKTKAELVALVKELRSHCDGGSEKIKRLKENITGLHRKLAEVKQNATARGFMVETLCDIITSTYGRTLEEQGVKNLTHAGLWKYHGKLTIPQRDFISRRRRSDDQFDEIAAGQESTE